MPAKKPTQKAPKRTGGASKVFTAEERAAMRDYVKEKKAAARGDADGEADVLAKIAAMGEPDRAIAERLHAIIKATSPAISARTWYGMPAYAKDGNVVCYLQPAGRFKSRYATLGFSDKAKLDDGAMWPVAFALKAMTKSDEARIVALLKQALG